MKNWLRTTFFLLHQTVAFTKDLMLAGGEGGSSDNSIGGRRERLIIYNISYLYNNMIDNHISGSPGKDD